LVILWKYEYISYAKAILKNVLQYAAPEILPAFKTAQKITHISHHFIVCWYKKRPIRVFDPIFKMLMNRFNTNPLTRADKLI
jgi:hypothetical protein